MNRRSAGLFSLTRGGFTMLEVLVCALLIALSLGSIVAVNAKSIDTLRASRVAAASSQVLQQRIEMLRKSPWGEISSASGLISLLARPTASDPEVAPFQPVERLSISIPSDVAAGSAASPRLLQLRRDASGVQLEQSDDFTAEPTLLVIATLTFRDKSGVHQRIVRTIVCAAGLTRSGLLGSQLGRPRD